MNPPVQRGAELLDEGENRQRISGLMVARAQRLCAEIPRHGFLRGSASLHAGPAALGYRKHHSRRTRRPTLT